MTREKEGTFDDDPKPRTHGHNEKKRELLTYLLTVEECLLLRDEHNNIMKQNILYTKPNDNY